MVNAECKRSLVSVQTIRSCVLLWNVTCLILYELQLLAEDGVSRDDSIWLDLVVEVLGVVLHHLGSHVFGQVAAHRSSEIIISITATPPTS